MGAKHVFAIALAAAALFGVAVSGCNRESDARMASTGNARRTGQSRAMRGQRARRAVETNSAVRPAEVLAGVAHRSRPGRSAARRFEPLPPAPAPRLDPRQERQLAAYEPLPEPVPVHAAASRAYVSEPYTLQPSRTDPSSYEKIYAHPSPELAMARAQLQGSAPLTDQVLLTEQRVGVPVPTPESFPVPIPELEPSRYSRATDNAANSVVATLPMPWQGRQPQPLPLPPQTAGDWAQQYARYANAALPSSPPQAQRPVPPADGQPLQGWVASPATAMRTRGN